MRPLIPGTRYGMLTLVEIDRTGNAPKWRCRCDCGNYVSVFTGNLRPDGHTKSCGCFVKKTSKLINLRHGMYQTKVYTVWQNMHSRCGNPNNNSWSRYGGRGITVCERWGRFDEFYEDMGDPPKGRTIDRINNDGPYSPENCRWATAKEQANNCHHNPAKGSKNNKAKLTESNIPLIRADTRPLQEIADEYGVYISVIEKIRSRTLWKHVPGETTYSSRTRKKKYA